MAAITIAKYALAFVLGYLVYMLLSPIMADVRYENPMWDDMPVSILAFGDQIHGLWLMLAVIIAAVILLAAFSESSRARASI